MGHAQSLKQCKTCLAHRQQALLINARDLCHRSGLNVAEISGCLETVKQEFIVANMPLVSETQFKDMATSMIKVVKVVNKIQGVNNETQRKSSPARR